MPRQNVPTHPSQYLVTDPKGGYLPGRGPLTYVHWYGGRVLNDLEAATVAAVRNITRAAADIARADHPWENRSGQLETSIFAAEPKLKGDHVYAIWGAHFPALFLEYGTVKMEPYPFLRPAAAKAYKLANFAGIIRTELAGSHELIPMSL